MNILFGIQGTGNGHISRGRMMAKYLNEADCNIEYLLSGREPDKFFDMEVYGDFLYRQGLTFHSENGSVSYAKTVFKNNLPRFLMDVKNFDIKKYDLVITDYEPVCAWAAKLAGVPVIGVGHQYAFYHDIPRAGGDPIAKLIMKNFAPANISLGLHWDKFNGPILPPIIDNRISKQDNSDDKKIVVYLPFENQDKVKALLEPIKSHRFVIYSPDLTDAEFGHISTRKTSLKGFKNDLTSSNGVLCNSGFELISECLYIGIPVLTKPQHGQMEQLSNAEALRQLNYAETVNKLSTEKIENWLEQKNQYAELKMNYPDVAKAVVDWIIASDFSQAEQLSERLWKEME